jgi:hypothetical protein
VHRESFYIVLLRTLVGEQARSDAPRSASLWVGPSSLNATEQQTPSPPSAPILDVVERSLATANSWMPTQINEAQSTSVGGMSQTAERSAWVPRPYGSTWLHGWPQRIGRAQGRAAADPLSLQTRA